MLLYSIKWNSFYFHFFIATLIAPSIVGRTLSIAGFINGFADIAGIVALVINQPAAPGANAFSFWALLHAPLCQIQLNVLPVNL